MRLEHGVRIACKHHISRVTAVRHSISNSQRLGKNEKKKRPTTQRPFSQDLVGTQGLYSWKYQGQVGSWNGVWIAPKAQVPRVTTVRHKSSNNRQRRPLDPTKSRSNIHGKHPIGYTNLGQRQKTSRQPSRFFEEAATAYVLVQGLRPTMQRRNHRRDDTILRMQLVRKCERQVLFIRNLWSCIIRSLSLY
jgi:hypothetical protein